MLQSGDTLAGYRIESVAGVGGMGVVYKATQTSLDRPVALKVLSSTLVGNRTFRERFRREGRHAAALDHPNIIPVYEAGESNGLMFIAMRLVDGPSLADLIASDGLSGRETLRVIGAIASALDAAHDAGLVHRDIKPQNILLTRTGHPYLADFGITKGTSHGGLTHSGDFVGSLNYVAPEQIDGVGVTGASDIYSLTAVLFECLSGLAPFERESDAALMLAHLQAPPPTLGERGVDVPPSLDAVFEAGMAKHPGERYATAGELVDACRAALAGSGAALERKPAFSKPSEAADPMALTVEPARLAPAPPRPAAPDATPAPAPVRRAAEPPADPDPAAPERPRRAVSRTTIAVVAAGVLVVAAVVGYALGHEDPPPSPVRASSAALSVTRDATWRPASGSIEGLDLEQPVTLRRSDGVKLTAGRMARFEPGFDPVPSALRARFAKASEPVAIRLGEHAAVRHAVELRSGDRLWLALVPDDRGWIAIACEGPGADRPAVCPAIASSVKVDGASGVAPGPDPAVAAAIAPALEGLDAARRGAKRGLRARTATARARAARLVGAAHARAAAQVRKAGARPQERSLVVRLADDLGAQARNFARLASAAQRRRVARYDSARDAIKRRERRLDATMDDLRAIGYET